MKAYTNFLIKIQELLYKHAKRLVYLQNMERLAIEGHFAWCGNNLIKNCLKMNNSTSYQRNKFALMLYEFLLNNFEVDKNNEELLRKKGEFQFQRHYKFQLFKALSVFKFHEFSQD